MKTDPLDKT